MTHSSELAGALARLLSTAYLVNDRTVIGIAGESGSGKSVTATDLARELSAEGRACMVLHQDDYFLRPPRTNHEHREQDLQSVGPQEVDLDRLVSHIALFHAGCDEVTVPSVDYPGNRFLTRRVDFSPIDVLIVEGTYVLTLADLDVRIFLEVTADATRERRRQRNRDIDAPIVEQVLDIEHALIAPQAERADIVIDGEFRIVRERNRS
jgi:uridine kinase